MTLDGQGTTLVAPHHLDLNREHALAEEFGYKLNAAVVTHSVKGFRRPRS